MGSTHGPTSRRPTGVCCPVWHGAGCPVSFLVQGAEKERKVDLAFTFCVLKGPGGRTVLVDAGFYRPQFFKEFEGITDYTRPDRAIGRLGIKPEEVTDVIITHMHSDHFDGVDLFPKATVWIQKDEFNHYAPEGQAAVQQERARPSRRMCLGPGEAEHRGPCSSGRRRRQGDHTGSDCVYTGGKHGRCASQYVGVNTKSGRMVVASDNVYLYENLDKHVPITATLDAKSNLAARGPDEAAPRDQPSIDHPGTRPGGVLSGTRSRGMVWFFESSED